MKKIAFLSMLLVMTLGLQARVLEVTSPADYATYYANSMTGDTLLLTASGTYTHQNLPSGKVITVMAADTAEVIINGEAKFESCDGGGIYYENLTLSNPRRLFWDAGKTGMGKIEVISFKNCVITDIAYSLICCQSSVDDCSIKKLIFDACTIHNISTAGWNFLYMFIPIEELVFNECTLYNEGKSTSLLDSRAAKGNIKITFTHNTVYQGAGTMFSLGNTYTGDDCQMVVEDNIFVCPDDKTVGAFWNITGGWWTISLKNNLFAGYEIPALGEDVGECVVENNYTPEDLNMTKDQIFADAMGSNFTIYSFSPLATLSTTGGVIGASKWLKDVEVVSLTHGLAEGVDPEAGTTQGPKGQVEKGQTFSIQAVKNFGYKFVKWIDASGATVSEDPILTVVADKDQAYYAVFEAVNVYKLSIDVVGGGKVTVSTPGKDGEYEYYEEGTVLYLTAHQNKVTTFLFWQGDNDFIASQPEIELTINSDFHLTAEFVEQSYICAFTFDTQTQAVVNNWSADLLSQRYKDQENRPVWECYSTDLHELTPYLVGSFWGTYQSYVWKKAAAGQGYYYQTMLNTSNYTSDVVVDFEVCGIYFSWNKGLLQMSYDNNRWETVSTFDITSGFVNYCDTLPYSAGYETLYIRFMPDLNGTFTGDQATTNECEAYRNIYFIAEAPEVTPDALPSVEAIVPVRYYNMMGQLVAPDTKGLVIRVQGDNVRKIMNK